MKKLSTMDGGFYPTGTGEPIKLAGFHMSGSNRSGPTFFADGTHALVCGFAGESKASRCYRTEVRAGAPLEPVTPEGVIGALFAGSDRTLVVSKSDGSLWVMTIGSDTLVPAKGLSSERATMGRSAVPNSVFSAPLELPLKVYRVNVLTGDRTLVRTLTLPDISGAVELGVSSWSDDGPYTYHFTRELSQLFVVSGVK